jgi:hypothetical protein
MLMFKPWVNNLFKFTYLLLLLTAGATAGYAQQFGGNPPAIKWKQVNTSAAKVIFPAGLDSTGLRVAAIVQRINNAVQPTIGYQQKKVSIVLQDQTTIANAYVGLAPFRSEFYLTPGQNSFEIGSLPWADQLAIHEFRHVQQYNNFNVGLSKGLHTLFGEGGQALANNIAIPDWFFEGDAVFNETHVSEQGRGRMPYFFNGYRALWQASKNYSWMKMRNGSYRDYIPDWYPMGYMLIAYGREKYGDDFWRKVTHDAASFKGVFYPMQKAIKKYSGNSFTDFRNNGFNHFKQLLAPQSLIHSSTHSLINNRSHFISNQEYPAFVNDSTIVYLRSTYDNLPQFVLNKDGHETKISVRSKALDDYFDYRNGKIVYAAYRPDARWTYRDYSELQVLDINTGKEHRLTSRTKYFAPAFNADGSHIIVVQVIAGKSDLHLLDAINGEVLSVIPNKANLFFTYPKFYGDDKLVSAVRNATGKMTVALIDIKSGEVKYLLPFSSQPIAFPFVYHDTVYFTATSGINDKLFALDILSGKLFDVDKAETSANRYQPTVINNKLAWVEFTAVGYQLRQAKISATNFTHITNGLPGTLPDFNISALKRDTATNILATVTNTPLAVTKYNKAYHLFNFHSLVPDFSDPNYSLALVGENVLNTFQSQVSFNYNRDEGYKQFGFEAIYGGLYPFIKGGVDYALDRRSYYKGSHVYYNESDLHAGLQLPLNFSGGKQITSLSIGSDVYYTRNTFQEAYRSTFKDRAYTYLNNYITFSNHIQQAKKNIYPRFGQTINLNYKSAVNGLSANQFLVSGTLYLPGIWVNHNLVINAAHQQKGQDNVINFSNNFPFSRGYTAENLHTLDKVGANYHFPIAYPDAGIANTIYFLRVRGNLFYDYTHATDTYTNGAPFKADFRSTGAEVYFDTKWFNQQSLTFGVRYSYLVDKDVFGGSGRNRVELVLPVSFF